MLWCLPALADQPGKIAVRRRNDSDVDLHGPGAAQTLKLAALQYPKQLGLEFQRQGVDLIFVFIYISYLFFYQNIDCLSIRFCQFYRDLLT
jgi:hypothetical protein